MGTGDRAGSAMYQRASANARRIASISRCRRDALSGSKLARSNPSRMLSASERGQPLPVRRALPDAQPGIRRAIRGADRFVPGAAMTGEVLDRHDPARGLDGRRDGLRNRALVERGLAALCDRRGASERVPDCGRSRRAAAPRPSMVSSRSRPAASRNCRCAASGPVVRRERRHREALFGEADGGAEDARAGAGARAARSCRTSPRTRPAP